MERKADNYVHFRLQVMDRLYGWLLGINGAGLLLCFAFAISEYQIIFNDCVSRYAAVDSISSVKWVGLAFLLGAIASGIGIAVHSALLGRYLNAKRKSNSELSGSYPEDIDMISINDLNKLNSFQSFIWSISISLFALTMISSFIAMFFISNNFVDKKLELFDKKCAEIRNPSLAPNR